MAGRFIDNYSKEPWRGYGPGPPMVFRLIKGGEPLLIFGILLHLDGAILG
jgi:hypothetical protein